MIAMDTVLIRREGIFYRHVPPETVVIRQGGPEVLVLNGIAGRILDLIDGRVSLRAVATVIVEEYDGPAETVERDVLAFGEELLAADVVAVADPG